METTTGAALFLAVLATGLMAGLFAAFAYAVMPGLGRSGDRTFVEAMRNINKTILNGWFLSRSAARSSPWPSPRPAPGRAASTASSGGCSPHSSSTS
ncbi:MULTISPECIES: hypothetical protein [unclassified Streptomyces]|uniref:hypothetical protein n=1 Tax=unclassified Streptomyces TaxID=2593676 RepID=UPI0026801B58